MKENGNICLDLWALFWAAIRSWSSLSEVWMLLTNARACSANSESTCIGAGSRGFRSWGTDMLYCHYHDKTVWTWTLSSEDVCPSQLVVGQHSDPTAQDQTPEDTVRQPPPPLPPPTSVMTRSSMHNDAFLNTSVLVEVCKTYTFILALMLYTFFMVYLFNWW